MKRVVAGVAIALLVSAPAAHAKDHRRDRDRGRDSGNDHGSGSHDPCSGEGSCKQGDGDRFSPVIIIPTPGECGGEA